MSNNKKSPISSTETYCSVPGTCHFFEERTFSSYCLYYNKSLGSNFYTARKRLDECRNTDKTYQDYWNDNQDYKKPLKKKTTIKAKET